MRQLLQNSHINAKKVFNDIYIANSDAIFRFCLIKVSDRERALDLTQDVFVRFWERLQGRAEVASSTIDNPRAFLFTIARNAVIDWYRKKKSVSLEGLADPETGELYEPFFDDTVVNIGLANEGRFLVDKISSLDSGYKDVIYLRFVEGLSPPEIGKILGISANATSVRINRGLEKLRELTGYDIDAKDADMGFQG